jgi:hypothetical protein
MRESSLQLLIFFKGSPGNLQDFDGLLFENAGEEAGRIAPVVMSVKLSTAVKDGSVVCFFGYSSIE